MLVVRIMTMFFVLLNECHMGLNFNVALFKVFAVWWPFFSVACILVMVDYMIISDSHYCLLCVAINIVLGSKLFPLSWRSFCSTYLACYICFGVDISCFSSLSLFCLSFEEDIDCTLGIRDQKPNYKA